MTSNISQIPQRILMGPGPSNVHPRVLEAMSHSMIGHLDPIFLEIMDENMKLLRQVFGTKNRLTLPISATGSAGMEATLCNLIEPDDDVLVCVNGVFGMRMSDIVDRYGGNLHTVDAPWGRIIDPQDVADKLKDIVKPKLIAIVHVETSTGILQPLVEIAELAKAHDALLVVDCVTSLCGTPVNLDELGIDAAYSGTQKCMSCPPGLSPVSFSKRAINAIHNRSTKVTSWYLDMGMISKYWGDDRVYHHTAPISMNYALNESLKIVCEEGLDTRYRRHSLHSQALADGLSALGIERIAQEGFRAPMLTSVSVPDDVDEAKVRNQLLHTYNIEIGAGLGTLKGKAWRIGLMGETCRRENVIGLLTALGEILPERSAAEAVQTAENVYNTSK